MKMKASAITAAALLALTAQTVSAAEAVGYNVVTVPANSDALVSVPFNKNAEGSFTVSSKTADGVTVAGSLTAGAYANGYYVRFTTGGGEGLWSTISDNGTGGFEFANTNVLTYISNGDTFRVYEHQTLSDLFPMGYAGTTFVTSGDEGTAEGGTQVLVPETAALGVDKAAAIVCTHYGSYGWADKEFSDVNQLVLVPGQYVKVRNPSTNALSVVISGDVPDTKQAGVLARNVSNNDLYLVNPFPVPVTLNQMGLESWASTDGDAYTGQVLLFNNADTGLDKASVLQSVYYTGDSNWYDGTLANVVNSSEIPAGMGVVLRDTAGVSGTGLWTVNKPY